MVQALFPPTLASHNFLSVFTSTINKRDLIKPKLKEVDIL